MDKLERGILNRRDAEILLAVVIVARATGYLFSKLLLEQMGQFTLLGVRSLLAFFFLSILFSKKFRTVSFAQVKGGFILGLSFFIVMGCELTALRFTTSTAVSFEENTAVAIVPLIMMLLTRKLPEKNTVIRVVLALLGVGFLCFKPEGFSFNIGDVFGMLSAVTYACSIVLTSKISKGVDPLMTGVFQVGFMGLFSIAAAFLFETPCLPDGARAWTYMLYLAIVCSGFGFTLQPVAQRGTTAERAGAFCALNPVAAAILGAVFLNETLSVSGIIGGILIVASILVR